MDFRGGELLRGGVSEHLLLGYHLPSKWNSGVLCRFSVSRFVVQHMLPALGETITVISERRLFLGSSIYWKVMAILVRFIGNLRLNPCVVVHRCTSVLSALYYGGMLDAHVLTD